MRPNAKWEDFLDRVWVGRRHECWMPHNLGIGGQYFRFNGVAAHRWVYEACRGSLGNLVPDHLCQKKWCLNPWHMDAVTRGENRARAAWLGRNDKECRKGHPWSKENTYVHPRNGSRVCRTCRRDGMRGKPQWSKR